jgi:putative hemolysin
LASLVKVKHMNKQLLGAIGLALFVGLTALWYFNVYVPQVVDRGITNFQECVKAYPMITMQFPARCTTKDGRTFVDSVTPTPTAMGLANPASVNCTEKGGTLNMVDGTDGQVGMCVLTSGKVCEEWAFFRGECQ